MRKFTVLLKKEVKEMMTLQMLIPLIIGILCFVFIGNVIGNENKKANARQSVAVIDTDQTSLSKSVVNILDKGGFNVSNFSGKNIEDAIQEAKTQNIPVVLTIPAGFEKGIASFKPQQIDAYSIVKSFSVTGSASSRAVKSILDTINRYISDQMIVKKSPGSNPADLKNPVRSRDFVIIAQNMANVSPDQVSGFIMSQSLFIPIIMFIVIVFAAQMIVVTIASEKENKTLETLLSTPISRASLVTSKMVAAGIVSLLMALVYMLGFRYYMNGVTGGMLSEASNPQMSEAVKQLGLTMDTRAYLALGISLFLSILIALAISLILGAFAEDVKKAQGFISVIIFLIMIPYLLSMFVDLNSTSLLLKYFVYAIPFSHPFLAAPNLFLHQYSTVLYGIIYEAVIFIVLVYIAAMIFSTDRILTMKVDFSRKKTTGAVQ